MAMAGGDVSVGVGIALLLLSLVCLGTWPALLRLCSYSPPIGDDQCCSCLRRLLRNQQQQQNRHPCHAYLDYALAYVAFSSTVPILLSYWIPSSSGAGDEGSSGPAGRLDHNLTQQVPLILAASFGGSLLSLGNMSTQWSTTVYASPLTTVLALQASLTVVLGTTINYKLEPSKTARPNLLAGGVMLFLLAIGLSVMAHRMYSNDERRPREVALRRTDDDNGNVVISMRDLTCMSQEGVPGGIKPAPARPDDYRACSSIDDTNGGDNLDILFEDGIGRSTPTSASTMGLAVAFCGGLCFGFFSPAFNIAVNNPFGWGSSSGGDSEHVGLSVASANFWFSLAFTATSVLWNLRLMRNPPRDVVPPSTLHRYLSDRLVQDRLLAILAGLICAAGNVLQFQGGHLAGFAASDLVQAFPLVGTVWDVAMFAEFRGAHQKVVLCLGCMYLVYLSGIVLLASSIGV